LLFSSNVTRRKDFVKENKKVYFLFAISSQKTSNNKEGVPIRIIEKVKNASNNVCMMAPIDGGYLLFVVKSSIFLSISFILFFNFWMFP